MGNRWKKICTSLVLSVLMIFSNAAGYLPTGLAGTAIAEEVATTTEETAADETEAVGQSTSTEVNTESPVQTEKAETMLQNASETAAANSDTTTAAAETEATVADATAADTTEAAAVTNSETTSAETNAAAAASAAQSSDDAADSSAAQGETAAAVRGILRAPSAAVNIHDMVSGVKIIGAPQDDQGIYQLKKYTNYNVELSFSEDGHGSVQFPNDSTSMVYRLPEGFDAVNASGTIDISVKKGGQIYVVSGNTYQVKDGVLTVNFNTQDQNFSILTEAPDTEFKVNLSGSFTSEETQWGQNYQIKAKLDGSHDAGIQKSGYFEPRDNKIHYTVTVNSSGANKGLQITDTIKGSILTLDQGSIAITGDSVNYSDKGQPYTQGTVNSSSAKRFVYTLPDMVDGEVITLTYTASVDVDSIHVKSTDDQTENAVAISDTEGTNPDNNSSTTHTEIVTVDLKKSAGNVSDVVDHKRTIGWTIDYNTPMVVSAKGDTITDAITSPNTVYSGDGIYVQRFQRDAQGNETAVGDPELVPWSALTVNTENSQWEWTIPVSDTTPYHYRITYDTVTDVSGLVKDTNVTNRSEERRVGKECRSRWSPYH